MKIQWALALSISLLSVATLEGCAVSGPPKFPDPQSASPKGGTFVNVDNLRNVAPGRDDPDAGARFRAGPGRNRQ